MGLVFRETESVVRVSKARDIVRLTSQNLKFLRSLGFKVQNAGHRFRGRV